MQRVRHPNKYMLSIYHKSGSVLSIRNNVVNEEASSPLPGIHITKEAEEELEG